MRSLLFILASLSFVFSSYARSRVAPSIEWLADQSDVVGVYSVVAMHIEAAPEAIDLSKNRGKWGQATVELELAEAKKGNPPTKLKSFYWLHPTDSDAEIRRDITMGHQVLCFLTSASGTHEREVRYSVNLDAPDKNGLHTAFSSAFAVLFTRDDILSILDTRLKHAVKVPLADERKFWVEVPLNSPAFKVLHGRSVCYLIIPEDLRPK
jgi:hypothetical protein